MKTLKVTTVGNSLGIVLPKELMSRYKIHKGDTLTLIEKDEGFVITPYDIEFIEQMRIAETIMAEDKNVLQALAEFDKGKTAKQKKEGNK